MVGVTFDITEYKKAEGKLIESEQRFRSLINNAADAFFLLDSEGWILDVNQSACSSLGYSRSELLSMNIADVDVEVQSQKHKERFWDTLQIGNPVTFEGVQRRKNGSLLPVEVRLGMLELGDEMYLLGLSRDISDRKQAEEERLAHVHLIENLDKINRAIQSATDLEEMMAHVLKAVLSIFDSDRAWLLFPCDPEAASWTVPMECTRPEYPGAMVAGAEVPMTTEVSQVFAEMLASGEPSQYVPTDIALQFNYQSQIMMAVYPKVGKPWVFGLHQCSYARVWTSEEARLLQEIARRLSDGLTSLLTLREVKESERKYRTLLHNMQAAVVVHGPDTRVLASNALAQELLGLTADEMLGKPADDQAWRFYRENGTVMPVEEYPVARVIATLNATRNLVVGAQRCDDTDLVWVLANAYPVFEDDGALAEIIVTFVDITDRKLAEQTLRESEEKYRELIELAGEGVWVVDRDLVTNFINDQMAKILGYETDELLNRKITEFVSSSALPQFLRNMELRRQSQTTTYELLMQRKDGSDAWCQVSGTPLLDRNGQFTGSFGMFTDITERKLAETELRKERENLKAIFASSPVGMFLVDSDLQVVDANKTVAKLVEKQVEDLTFRKLCDAISCLNRNDVRCEHDAETVCKSCPIATAIRQVFETGGSIHLAEIQPELQVHGDRIEPWLSISAEPVRIAGMQYAIVALDDISERKQAEQERAALEEYARQSQKMEAIGTLAGGIAHDFNNILFAILAYSEMVSDDLPKDSEDYDNIQVVITAANRAKELVNQILTFSRKKEPQVVPLNLTTYVKEVSKMLRATIPAMIQFKQELEPITASVLADPTEMHQVILNLCTNAAQAIGDQKGVLEIGLREVEIETVAAMTSDLDLPPGRYVLLTVSDDGIGMTPETKRRIFEPFFTTKPPGFGTGMGLSVVHGILSSIGAGISVESAVGKGAKFTIGS